MAKTFDGKFDVLIDTKGRVNMRRSEGGKYTAADATTVYETILKVAKERKIPIRDGLIYKPEAKKGEKTVTLVLRDRFSNPYIAILPERSMGVSRRRVEIL